MPFFFVEHREPHFLKTTCAYRSPDRPLPLQSPHPHLLEVLPFADPKSKALGGTTHPAVLLWLRI